MKDYTRELIIAAEREAQMVSAIARLLLVASAIAIFLLSGGMELPVALLVLPYLGFYGFVSIVSGIFATRRFFRVWMGTVFTAIDGISLAVLIAFVLQRTGSPPSYFGAVPGFIFIFSVMILATMRYTIGPIVVSFLSFFLTLSVVLPLVEQGYFSAIVPASPAASSPNFFFGSVQSAARWGYVAIAAMLGLFVVLRRRRMLETAIILGQKEANLSRYLPSRVSQLVAEQGIDALSRGQRQQAAVLFVDIRGFTGMSETKTPEELTILLSEFRSVVSRAIEANNGIVDKFIGDAVMAVFGVPETSPDDAENALKGAQEVMESIDVWNESRSEPGNTPINVAMGVHFGEVFAGAVGTTERLEYTVLGDTVNVAARLQERAKETKSGLVVSEALLKSTGKLDAEPDSWRAMDSATIRGRHSDIPHFSHA